MTAAMPVLQVNSEAHSCALIVSEIKKMYWVEAGCINYVINITAGYVNCVISITAVAVLNQCAI
jgi:hypothetical protein